MTIAAIFRNGVFEPTEPIEVAEGTPARIELLDPQQSASPREEPTNEAAAIAKEPSPDWSWRSLGLVAYVAPDFDEPLEDFKEYME